MAAVLEKNHYRLYPVKRHSFQRTCKIRGWDFSSFAEKLASKKSGNNKTYYYKWVGFEKAEKYNREGKGILNW